MKIENTSEATKKNWLLRFKNMLEVLELDYSDVAELSGNSYNTVKNITVKGVPRNMRFAIEVFEKMNTELLPESIFCDVDKITQLDFETIVFHATGETIDAKEKDAQQAETKEYGKVIYVDVNEFCRVYVCSDFQVFVVLAMRHPCKNYNLILPILLKYIVQKLP